MTVAPNDASTFADTMTDACAQASAMTTAYVNAATTSSNAAWQGVEELTRDIGSAMQETYARAVSTFKTILLAKTPQEAVDTHAEFMKDCFDGTLASGGKLTEMSMRIAKNTIEPLTRHANDAIATVMKKARAG